MKKPQLLLVLAALALTATLYLGGKTVPPAKPATAEAHGPNDGHNHEAETLTSEKILQSAKADLSPSQSKRITELENAVVRGDVKEQRMHQYHQLAKFWKDSVRRFEPYAYYTAEAAKLENSEKNLTFAARLLTDRLLATGEPALQTWLASNAKVLYESALKLNPKNDSNRIGLGACYIFGNISQNPMEGIGPIREIVAKNPNNLYAQTILGLGGKKSGQYDKAIERFLLVEQKDPQNLEILFHLAECYDLKGDKTNAILYYEKVKQQVAIPQAKEELEKRISELRK